MTTETVIANARVVRRDEVIEGAVCVRDGSIVDVSGKGAVPLSAVDFEGDYLMPGLIEMHTDNMEKHFMPRPKVLWPSPVASVLAHDAQIAAAGITTVYDAICVGIYRDDSMRDRILADSIDAVGQAGARGHLRAEHRVHLRCEVADPHVIELFEPYADHPLVRLVSVMDHTPGQRQWSDIDKMRDFYSERQWSEQQIQDYIAGGRAKQAKYADVHRRTIIDMARERGLPLASHDDTTEAHVAEAVADGIAISEFPTTHAAAQAARDNKMTVVMGAPNVVRGGSHSGNASALDLAAAGLLDGLSSDYVPSSLLHGAFVLNERVGMGLSDAIATVSANVADVLGLDDRGAIEIGRRADLIRVHDALGTQIVRTVWREGERVS